MCSAYLQELSELEVAELFLTIVPKIQTDELTVPVEGNVVVHCGLAEDVLHIICSTNTHKRKALKAIIISNHFKVKNKSLCDKIK